MCLPCALWCLESLYARDLSTEQHACQREWQAFTPPGSVPHLSRVYWLEALTRKTLRPFIHDTKRASTVFPTPLSPT